MHATRFIGGVKHRYKSAEEDGAVYEPVPEAKQRQALDFIRQSVLVEPAWLIPSDYALRLSADPQALIAPVADQVVSSLFSSVTIGHLCASSDAPGAYAPQKYVSDVVDAVFPSQTPGRWLMSIQRKAVQSLLKEWDVTYNEEAHAYVTLMLQLIQRKTSASPSDAATRAHYADLNRQIRLSMEN